MILDNFSSTSSDLALFSYQLASVSDINGIRNVLKKQLKHLLQAGVYIITLRNDDLPAYRYFMHDHAADLSLHECIRRINNMQVPVDTSMTGAVLRSEKPIVFNVKDVVRANRYVFPEACFWKAAGVENVMGVRLRLSEEDLGILWLPAQVYDCRLKGVAAQVTIALSNALLREKMESCIQELLHFKKQLHTVNAPVVPPIVTEDAPRKIIGAGREMQRIHELISMVAFAESTVLILGETGTGKELIARAIHDHSPRKDKRLVKINCAALPAHLVESELFGHERGSFTGATERKTGKFEQANNGTLFLDEIGEMPVELQAKLLRAIQEKEIERVGGKTTIRVDVRIIAATNLDLQQAVAEGRFRSDLYYRLNVFPICLPPLRERLEDMELLVTHFIEQCSQRTGKNVNGISPRVLENLRQYNWPGNIRELQNVIERAFLLSKGEVIKRIDLPRTISLSHVLEDTTASITLEENERNHIVATLKKCNNKISGTSGAAYLLQVPASTLYSRMRKLGIKKEQAFKA